jgi:predicted 3-demethylubiquinone-9 3-methyltransferase (glyoxalase superfamily)
MMSKVSTCLWFDGKAEEAARFYVSLLPESHIDSIVHSAVDTPGAKTGETVVVEFTLAGSQYTALNGGPNFRLTPAASLVVRCQDQAELDHIWSRLLEGGSAIQCGWLTDRYGLSWQITPVIVFEMLKDKDAAKARRVMQALMGMIKIDIHALQRAFDGKTAN